MPTHGTLKDQLNVVPAGSRAWASRCAARAAIFIAPPSLNTKLGTAYRHADPKYKFKFAVAPDWLYDIILKEKQSAKDKGTEEPPHRPNGRPRQSNAYGLAALQDECNKLSAVPPGERNGQLFLSAIRMGQLIAGGHLAYGVACHELYQAAVANGLDKDYAGPQGVRKTIESGMRRGLNEPRTLSGSYGSSYTGSGPDEVDDPLGEWDAGDDDVVPPPRGWLLGNIFCRQFCSSLLGEGAIGKTAVRYCHYLSLAAGKSLTGEHVFQRSRVLIVSLEDGVDELRRRLRAVCLHYGLRLEDLRGYLFLAAPGASVGKLMHANGRGAPIPGKLIEKLSQVIVARKIDLVGLDPYVKTHGMPENDNTAMDKVAQVLTDLAIKHNVAVDCPHHISKGPSDPGNANRGRGASATKDAFRLVHTLAGMSREEAEGFGISEAERRFLVRMDSGKVNMAPPEEASWFKLVGVRIDNGTELYPSGDEVQTVEQWIPPKCFDGISNALANQILTAIDKGLPNGQRYSDAPKADDRAAWKVVTDHVQGKTEAQGRRVIGTWRKSGLLIIGDYDDPVTRKRVKGLSVDDTKRPS